LTIYVYGLPNRDQCGRFSRIPFIGLLLVNRDDPDHDRVTADLRLLPRTSESFAPGLRLYAERPDKEYSLTDCISIAVMRAAGMTESATGGGICPGNNRTIRMEREAA
jgi:hypothetical protein